MQLAILAAVLATLAQADEALPPLSGLAWRLLLAASAALVAPLAALVGAQRLARQIDLEGAEAPSESRLQSLIVLLWLITVAVILYVVRWPQIVRSNWSLSDWPLIDELAILTPVIAPLFLLWTALYRLERAGQVAAFRERGIVPPPPALLAYLWLHVRYHLGLVLLPALVVIGGQELLALARIDLASGQAAFWFGLPLVATMLLLMPVLVRRMWQTSPLPAGSLRDDLTAICRARRCGVREILIWHTQGYVANAAVVGMSRWLRYVLLTDALIVRLSPVEIAAVLRHELGHLRRRHLPLRLALLALPLAWWLALEAALPDMESRAEQALANLGIPGGYLTAIFVPLAMLVYALVVVGWYSRLLEHEADLEACLDDNGRFDPQYAADIRRALVRLLGRDRETWLSGLLHPALGARLDVIERAGDPHFVRRFRQRMLWIAAGVAALYAGSFLLATI